MEIADAIKRNLDTTSSELAGVEKKISDLGTRRDILAKKKATLQDAYEIYAGKPAASIQGTATVTGNLAELVASAQTDFSLSYHSASKRKQSNERSVRTITSG